LINYFKSYSSLGDDRFFSVTLYFFAWLAANRPLQQLHWRETCSQIDFNNIW